MQVRVTINTKRYHILIVTKLCALSLCNASHTYHTIELRVMRHALNHSTTVRRVIGHTRTITFIEIHVMRSTLNYIYM